MIRTYFILLICVSLWASNFIIASVLVEYVNSLTITIIRLVCIVLFLVLLGYRQIQLKLPTVKLWLLLMFAALLGVSINHYSFFKSMETTTPIVAAYILALTPITTGILNKMLFKEKKPRSFWLGSVLSFIGVIIIVSFKGEIHFTFGTGELFSVLTMVSFAGFLVCLQVLSKDMNSLTLTFSTVFFGLLFLLPFSSIPQLTEIRNVESPILVLLVVSAILIHGLSNLVWNKEMPKVGASVGALFLNLEPLITIALSFIFLGDGISAVQIVGSVFVLCGIAVSLNFFNMQRSFRNSMN